MGIEDIQISEELMTNAPSIKYRGGEGPKSPQEQQQMMMAQLEEEYLKYVEDMLEQGMEPMSLQQFMEQAIAEGQMSGGNPLPQDPTKPINPFQPKPTGPTLPNRQMAAYGGIMGLDGRKKYGIGSWFQENIMDPIKENPEIAAAALAAGANYYDIIPGDKYSSKGYLDNFFDYVREDPDGDEGERKSILSNIGSAVTQNLVPIVGGLASYLFTKDQPNGQPGMPSDNTALKLADLKKSANILDQKQGLASNLNFLPSVAARKFTPAEMIETYAQNDSDSQAKLSAANGGRIGFNMGGGADMTASKMTAAQVSEEAINKIMQKMKDPNLTDEDRAFLQAQLQNFMPQQQMPMMGMEQMPMMAMGGRINRAEGGIMDLGGLEKDYRNTGGFVEIGAKEKADDVPARLSVNEFVFTADAVRNAGGGDIDQGAQVMENMMKHLEQGGQVSEESQGMAGARDMFATSERLSEVI
jgi:hypothetical protein